MVLFLLQNCFEGLSHHSLIELSLEGNYLSNMFGLKSLDCLEGLIETIDALRSGFLGQLWFC